MQAKGFLPDRRTLTPDAQPYTALVKLFANGGVGCGVLVGPDLVLTAAHVVSTEQATQHSPIDVEAGVGSGLGKKMAQVRYAYFPQVGRGDPASGNDWALVRIDRPLGHLYGWVEPHLLSDKEWSTARIELAGYCSCPDEKRKEFADMARPYRVPARVSDLGPGVVFHDGSMWGGTSGAPLLAELDGKWKVVAVNSAGVDIEGEVLEAGFRKQYSKDVANLAVPARLWIEQFRSMALSDAPPLREFWLRNASRNAIEVCARYRDVFEAPNSELKTGPWIRVDSGRRVAILKPQDGFNSDTLQLSVRDLNGRPLARRPSTVVSMDGEDWEFFSKSLGRALNYTMSWP